MKDLNFLFNLGYFNGDWMKLIDYFTDVFIGTKMRKWHYLSSLKPVIIK